MELVEKEKRDYALAAQLKSVAALNLSFYNQSIYCLG